ncbi:sarcosine oxidase/N-methyl-L-tryptophan oxidase [Salinibacillus kushneri]|uniref:Sarcosine oxidase/N-methyl-L-tryptophan oxidase n=1 Tax=Salinibacillus kushneri TaxID=237682 RepID=A0A1I0BCL2_9BACI|nr:N-methyl-L-tryptophan oxidase [Salinibacillus kushneri]SET03865.1 sarcosine oxidase/N-methyl-L-tryptophan oxidase [Salinibacillus kushneri]
MHFHTMIVGAGSMGMAAGYYLAKQGQTVLLLDAYDPPHQNGSHHGETRIIRHAYGEGEHYVPLALRAQELWYELEKEAGMDLFLQTGVLNIGTKASSFIQEVQASSKKHHLPLETLSAEEISQKWEGLSLPDTYIGCLETTSGVLFSEKIIQSYRSLAEAYGATMKTNTNVIDIEVHTNSATIHTDTDTFEGDRLIVTAGPWSKQLGEKMNVSLPLKTTRKTFSWFDCKDHIYDAEKFPAFTFDIEQGTYYGFPSIEGSGVKMGRHDGGRDIQIGESLKPYGHYKEDRGDVSKILHSFFPHVSSQNVGKTCIYTMTPDGDFIIDHLPEHPHVTIACGFSGHGYKFSSAVGEILCKMSMNETIDFDLSPFSMKRFMK